MSPVVYLCCDPSQPEVLVLFDTYKNELNSLYRFYSGANGMTLAVFSQMAKVVRPSLSVLPFLVFRAL